MTGNSSKLAPDPYDVVLGGQTPAPINGVVLGGLPGVKRRLASPVFAQRVAALKEALKYGQSGLGYQTVASARWETTAYSSWAFKLG